MVLNKLVCSGSLLIYDGWYTEKGNRRGWKKNGKSNGANKQPADKGKYEMGTSQINESEKKNSRAVSSKI